MSVIGGDLDQQGEEASQAFVGVWRGVVVDSPYPQRQARLDLFASIRLVSSSLVSCSRIGHWNRCVLVNARFGCHERTFMDAANVHRRSEPRGSILICVARHTNMGSISQYAWWSHCR